MNEQRLSLDVSKRPATAQVVHLREGDANGTVLAVEILDGGAPADLDGCGATLAAKLPDGSLYEVDGTVLGSTASFEVDETGMAEGRTELAYIEITDTDIVCSTQAFTIVVEPMGRSAE